MYEVFIEKLKDGVIRLYDVLKEVGIGVTTFWSNLWMVTGGFWREREGGVFLIKIECLLMWGYGIFNFFISNNSGIYKYKILL